MMQLGLEVEIRIREIQILTSVSHHYFIYTELNFLVSAGQGCTVGLEWEICLSTSRWRSSLLLE